jgi:UDPglucose 6-dehydrogenase
MYKIAVIGTGYVGLVTGTCFAEMGNIVWCVDMDTQKIDKLNAGITPIYEPGLKDMIARNVQENRLYFTTDIKKVIAETQICFIAVGTPPRDEGSADTAQVFNVASTIGKLMDKYLLVVNKSTVPVGTADKMRAVIQAELKKRGRKNLKFDLISNPEFLKEGVAIEDFMRPDRIIIGTDNAKAAETMKHLYEPFTRNQHPIIVMDIKSAEMTKYAANAMLALRISFMNEIAQLCDNIGVDVNNVRVGIGSDQRIGMQFLYAGLGYGGSCLPKDLKELIITGEKNNVAMEIAKATEKINESQKHYFLEKIFKRIGQDLTGKLFGIWGLSFKPQTDDMREAPAMVIMPALIERGAKLLAYDPVAIEQAKKIFGNNERIKYVGNMLDAVSGADALVLITEWKQFRQPDFNELKNRMKNPIIFDGRNQYNPSQMRAIGFEYYCIGRNTNEQ